MLRLARRCTAPVATHYSHWSLVDAAAVSKVNIRSATGRASEPFRGLLLATALLRGRQSLKKDGSLSQSNQSTQGGPSFPVKAGGSGRSRNPGRPFQHQTLFCLTAADGALSFVLPPEAGPPPPPRSWPDTSFPFIVPTPSYPPCALGCRPEKCLRKPPGDDSLDTYIYVHIYTVHKCPASEAGIPVRW